MDILTYRGKVKEFKAQDIITYLTNIQVGAQDLAGNISSLKANDIDLVKVADHWIVSKGISKGLANAGFRNASLFESLDHCLKAVETLIPELIKVVRSYKGEHWHGDIMTLRQLNLLNIGEYLGFWLRYTGLMLDTLLSMDNTTQAPERLLSKDDLRFLNGTEAMYRSFTLDLMKGARYILAGLNKVPDIQADSGTLDVVKATEGSDSVDLLQKGFAVHLVNPVFWMSLGWSKIQLARIENMRSKNQLFAMKISQAIAKRNQAPSPQIDREIEIYQDAIAKNEHKIEQIEADYV